MKIKLMRDLPIGTEHGATKDRVFDLLEDRGDGKYWFMGDAGEECAAFGFEVEVIKEPNKRSQE